MSAPAGTAGRDAVRARSEAPPLVPVFRSSWSAADRLRARAGGEPLAVERDRFADPLGQRDLRAKAERVRGPVDVQHAAWLAVGAARVPHDLPLEPGLARDQL